MVQQRPAFVFTMAIMFGLAILGIVVFIAILQMFISVIVPTIPDIMTEVPTLYDYDALGNKIIFNEIATDIPISDSEIQALRLQIDELLLLQNEAIKNNDYVLYENYELELSELEDQIRILNSQGLGEPNLRLTLYWLFAWPSIIILLLMITIAASTYFFEQGLSIFPQGTSMKVIKTSIVGVVAILLIPEFWDIFAINMKQFSMYLLDPLNGNPEITTQRLWCKMGCIVNLDEMLDQDVWNVGLSNPSNFGRSIFEGALLPLFKSVPTAMVTMMFFVINQVRILFIMIILITSPLWFVSMNIPFLKETGNSMIKNMIGASIAPMFSALTMSVGLTYIDSINSPALEEWVSVLSIAIFASTWPVLLAPKLGIISSQATQITQTMLQSGAMLAGNMAGGMANGMAGSGAIGATGMSAGNKFKTMMGAGLMGGAMGGANSVSPMNIPPDARNNMNTSMNRGMAQNIVNDQTKGIDATNPSMIDPQISNGTMYNTGNHVNSMGKMTQGQDMINDPVKFDQTVQNEVSRMGLTENQKSHAGSMVRQKIQSFPSGYV